MAQNKKAFALDGYEYDTGLFENREIDVGKPPVFLLSAVENTKVLTAVSEAGLLSSLEENGVFSKLESAGAFSTIEKTLPTVESLGLLSAFESALDVDAGLLFTAANFAIAFGPSFFVLQICGFLPDAGSLFPLELLALLSTTVAGAALWAVAFAVSKLQIE